MYAKLLLLLSDECLTHNNNIGKDKGNGSENSNSNRNEKKSNFSSGHFKTLTDANIEQVISNIKDSYRKGYRDPIIFGLAGLMFKNKIKFQSTKDLEKLCDFTKDEEKSSRLSVVQNTYLNGLEGARSKEQNSF